MKKLNVHAGHNPDGKTACGAVGLIKESTEARAVVTELLKILKEEGCTAYNCTVDNGTSQSDVINKIIAKCNANSVDLDISIHFNAGVNDKEGDDKTTGVEVLVYNKTGAKAEVADRVCKEVSKLGFRNRGVKVRTDLGVLSKTKAQAILIECCFVDDYDDVKLYDTKKMTRAIARAVLNKELKVDKEAVTETPAEPETYYRVCVGSYKDRSNAVKYMEELKKKGVNDSFIVTFSK